MKSKQQRKEEAAERQALRDSLTPQQQMKRLDALLGVGVGAVKERAKLNKEIEDDHAEGEGT